jgi:hypothetical protein
VLDSLLVITLAVVLMYASVFLMALVVNGEVLLLPWQMGAGLLVFFAVLFPLIALAVFQNHADATFAVTPEGYEVHGGARARKVNRAVLVLALLSRRPGAVGAAMLASAGESTKVSWRDVRSARYHPGPRVIELRDSSFKMSRLFCPPELYEDIAARVGAEIAHAPRSTRPVDWSDARARVGWGAVTALGWMLAVAWWPDDTLTWLTGAAVAIVVAQWVDWWLGRAFAIAGLGCVAVAATRIGMRAIEATDYDGLFTIHGYDRDSGLLWITCAGLLLLALVGVRRALPRPRGN